MCVAKARYWAGFQRLCAARGAYVRARWAALPGTAEAAEAAAGLARYDGYLARYEAVGCMLNKRLKARGERL
jgi:hypothetical protein